MSSRNKTRIMPKFLAVVAMTLGLGSACTQSSEPEPVAVGTFQPPTSAKSTVEMAASDLLYSAASWMKRLDISATPDEAVNPKDLRDWGGSVLDTNPAASLNESFRSTQLRIVGSTNDDPEGDNSLTLVVTDPGENRVCLELDFNFSKSSPLSSTVAAVTPEAIMKASDESQLLLRNFAWGVREESTSCTSIPQSLTRYDGEDVLFYNNGQTSDKVPASIESSLEEMLQLFKGSIATGFAGELEEREPNFGSELGDYTPVEWCGLQCAVNSKYSFVHPTWGPVSALTTIAPENGASAVVILSDATDEVMWIDRSSSNYEYRLALDAPDSSGNIFVQYNPGRYDGIEVLRPTSDGIEVLVDDYSDSKESPLFYSAALKRSPNGGFEIEKIDWSCDPTCAEGESTSVIFGWDGSAYVPR